METPKVWTFALLAMALFFIGAELIPAAAASESGTGEAENGAARHGTAAANQATSTPLVRYLYLC